MSNAPVPLLPLHTLHSYKTKDGLLVTEPAVIHPGDKGYDQTLAHYQWREARFGLPVPYVIERA